MCIVCQYLVTTTEQWSSESVHFKTVFPSNVFICFINITGVAGKVFKTRYFLAFVCLEYCPTVCSCNYVSLQNNQLWKIKTPST